MQPLSISSSEPAPLPMIRESYPADAMVGESAAIRRARERLLGIARRPGAPVLIRGEIGTGKALAARMIHANSRPPGSPFILVTCSALPEGLLEKRLFGHEAAGPDDTSTPKRGLLELANGGTLFLDEVGDLPARVQTKLLDLIEHGSFQRVGGSEALRVDVGVMAATSRDLDLEVAQGRFDRDLLEQLEKLDVQLPPLRDRAGDIPLIARHFVELLDSELGRKVESIDPDVLDWLQEYEWPGNVRELRNCLERAMLLSEHDTLHAEDFSGLAEGPRSGGAQPPRFTLPEGGVRLEDVERQLVTQALERTGWNQTRAGELLGLNRDRIRYRIMKFGLRPSREARAEAGDPGRA